MSRDEDKLIRQLSLLSLLLSRPRPFTAREVQESVEGYAEMSDETFTRRFHGDRTDLGKIGIEIKVLSSAEAPYAGEAQLYCLHEEDFRLPAVDFTSAEVRALVLALAALDGRFAYARPLRMALTAVLRGRHDPVRSELEHLPVALAPDEDAVRAGKQLSRLEEAVTRGKTVCFAYPSDGDTTLERTLDPYSLFLIQGHWYVVGRDHLRDGIRTFRLGRIQGAVRFLGEKSRDFSVPRDYDPDRYGARPPWMIGPLVGTAVVRVGGDLAWWVQRLEPHVSRSAEEDDGCALFTIPYADEVVLLSWVVGLGGCGELVEPPALRSRLRDLLSDILQAHEGEPPDGESSATSAGTGTPAPPAAPAPHSHPRPSADTAAPIAPEHLARALTLLYYLVDEARPPLIAWEALEADLGLSRAEVEADLSLINLVNYGGGTYALTAEATPQGVEVVRDVMAGTFSHPARLSPVMARALLLALDLLGDTLALEGLESLSSVRQKVRALVGSEGAEGTVFVEDVLPPEPQVLEVLNHGIRDHREVEIDYYTASKQRLSGGRVEPYLLFHSPDAWYLEAYCLKTGGQRTFRLDRIREARLTDQVFAHRREVDLTGRRTGQAFAPEDVAGWATLRFRPRWSTYLEDAGLEGVPLGDGRLQVRMPYMDERWMAQETVRFLGDAELVHPPSTRRRIRGLAAALLGRYQDPGIVTEPGSA